MSFSLVIPFFNEEQNLTQLLKDLESFSQKIDIEHEIILIDDGSTDRSLELAQSSPFKVISHTSNMGQGASWRTGIAEAQKEYLIFLDSDLQFSLDDILPMIGLIHKGYKIVWGWRKIRKDPWTSILASRVGNAFIHLLFSIRAHDCGCSLKIIQKNLLSQLPPMHNAHRYFPVFLKQEPMQVEYIVRHYPRLKGKSKYGLFKVFSVLKELIELKRLGF